METKLIVTHPGGAHKDDFLACAVLMSEWGVAVERREPTVEDLEDAEVAVVDVGGEHEAARLNFDHHQFPRDTEPRCALSLVLEYLGLYEDGKRFFDWLETAEWIDVRGPNVTAAWLEVSREQMARLNTPVDGALIRWFASCDRVEPGEALYETMVRIGEDMAGYLRSVRERIELARGLVERRELEVGGKVYPVLFLPRTEPLPDEPSGMLAQYVRAEGLQGEVTALVYPDRRGEGYGLTRYQDHPDFDFTRLEGLEDVHFAHASGFLAKTSATEEERLMSLVRMAIVRGDC